MRDVSGDQGEVVTVGAAEGNNTDENFVVEEGGTTVPDSEVLAVLVGQAGAEHGLADGDGDGEVTQGVLLPAGVAVYGVQAVAAELAVSPDFILLLTKIII